MLVELRLENYAVIDNAAVEFASGLNLLTGETGAGKSILDRRPRASARRKSIERGDTHRCRTRSGFGSI